MFLPTQVSNFSSSTTPGARLLALWGKSLLARAGGKSPMPPTVRKSNLKLNWPILNFRLAPAISPSGNFGVSLGFCLTHWG